MQENGKEAPSEIKGWNWGAFSFSWIWGIGNKTYLPLLTLIPILGLIWRFIVGFKGNEWAWQKGNYDDIKTFQKVQSTWNRAGIVALIIRIILLVLYILLCFKLFNFTFSNHQNTNKSTINTTQHQKNKSQENGNSKREKKHFSKIYKVGQTISYNNYSIKVNTYDFYNGNHLHQPKQGYVYVVVDVTLSNDSKDINYYQPYSPSDFRLVANNGTPTTMNYTMGQGEYAFDALDDSGVLIAGDKGSGRIIGQAPIKYKNKLMITYKPDTFRGVHVWNDNTIKVKLD